MPGSNREIFNNAHYNVIAKRIREAREVYSPNGTPDFEHLAYATGAQKALDMVVSDLADWFSEDNPRFERDTWLEATNTNES